MRLLTLTLSIITCMAGFPIHIMADNQVRTSMLSLEEIIPLKNTEATFSLKINMEWPDGGTNDIALREMQKKDNPQVNRIL